MAVSVPVQIAARVALSKRGRRAFAAIAATVIVLPVLAVAAITGEQASGEITEATSGVPTQFVPLYNIAAKTYGVNPYLIASIHKTETGFSTASDTWQPNSAGCIGPFQMNLRDTWAGVQHAYKKAQRPDNYPNQTSSHPHPNDTFDAVMAAALLLKLKVAHQPLNQLDDIAWEAARRYNGAGPVAEAYATRVLAQARQWENENALTQQATPGISLAGGNSRLAWSVPQSSPITGQLGEQRPGHRHAGIDLAAPNGTPIYTAETGRVSLLQTTAASGGYGNFVCVSHTSALSTCYAHLSRFATTHGAQLARGQLLGYIGNTGHSFGDHLHFEVRVNNRPVNPLPYLTQ